MTWYKRPDLRRVALKVSFSVELYIMEVYNIVFLGKREKRRGIFSFIQFSLIDFSFVYTHDIVTIS